jgi:release factor glutamine methyltransferase
MPLEAVHAVERELRAAGVPSPRVDAEILVADVLGLARSELYSSGRDVSDFEAGRLRELVERRVAREPLAYILGEWGFRRLDLKVDERALVPRPETEVVVERCLELLRPHPIPAVLDVGTGSGAIALALADERPDLRVTGTDTSAGALDVARANAARLGLDVEFVQGDLLEPVDGTIDAVVSNPPYVREGERLPPEITRYEPAEALYAGPDGLDVYRRLAPACAGVPFVAFEIAGWQAEAVAALLEGYSTEVLRDLAGIDRVVIGRR